MRVKTVQIPMTMPETALAFYIAIEKYISFDITCDEFLDAFKAFAVFTHTNYGVDIYWEASLFVKHSSTRPKLRAAISKGFDSEFDREHALNHLRDSDTQHYYKWLLSAVKGGIEPGSKFKFEKLCARQQRLYENNGNGLVEDDEDEDPPEDEDPD